jgi:hypothetical protein
MFAGIDCAACPHVMQPLSGTLKTYVRALETCVPNCIGRTARLFFMLEARETRGSAGAHLSWEARSRAIGHMAASEPNSDGK